MALHPDLLPSTPRRLGGPADDVHNRVSGVEFWQWMHPVTPFSGDFVDPELFGNGGKPVRLYADAAVGYDGGVGGIGWIGGGRC